MVFGNCLIPPFEVNYKTSEILTCLLELNKKKDQEMKILIEDMKQKTNEYKSEGDLFVLQLEVY